VGSEKVMNIKKFIPEPIEQILKPLCYKINRAPQKAGVELNSSMSNYTNHVRKQIESNNPWYTGAQFAWAKKESIRRIYDHRFLFFYKILKREISKKGRTTLLDYGCGDGYWCLVFSRFLLCEVSGVDYNPLRLERCRKVMRNIKFIEADLNKSNEQLGKFDIVFCNQVIEHVKDDVSFLKGIRDHLKKDGTLILGTPNEGSFTHRFRNYFSKGETDHVHFYKEKGIRDKIEKASFIVKDIYREVFFPGFDRLYYRLTSTDLGFKLLELLTIIIPSQCSDYYFECKRR
jgi:2-polyprenyl-3-methyl-5-hydroxy-6-metoxy-1,4-benzoquinol methylase